MLPLLLFVLAATPILRDAGAVQIVSQQARWTSLGAPDALSDDREPWFLISGEIENRGSVPVPHVRLRYELLADDQVVASETGYNRRAEGLRDPAVESGAVAASTLDIAPLAAGERDGFRMMFLRADVPRFDSWRVSIIDDAPRSDGTQGGATPAAAALAPDAANATPR